MFRGLKLGRRPPRVGLALPRLTTIAPDLPAPRPVVDWSLSIAGYSMLGNDIAGCCTYAAAANARRQFGIYQGTEPHITQAEVLYEYARATGYNATVPTSDRGQVETDLLHDWVSLGFTFGGKLDRIDGYAAVDYTNSIEVRQAIDLFGGVMLGAALPLSAMDQGLSWFVTPGAGGKRGSLGGHEMWCNGADDVGLTVITWGQKVRVDWDWWLSYADDAQVVLSRDWVLPNGRTAAGVEWAALQRAMAALSA